MEGRTRRILRAANNVSQWNVLSVGSAYGTAECIKKRHDSREERCVARSRPQADVICCVSGSIHGAAALAYLSWKTVRTSISL